MVNGINWLNNNSDSIYIAPKSLESSSIVVDAGSASAIKLISWVRIPAVLFTAGFVVWVTRRNR